MTIIKNEIKRFVKENGYSHILIHSDILFGFKITFQNHNQFLNDHYTQIRDACQDVDVIFPTFNYDFCKGKPYNITNDPSQVGVFSEYFRQNKSSWRSPTPVFNFAGTGTPISTKVANCFDPFDNSSIFGYLYNNNGLLMHYGSGFHTTTLIHFVERISGKLIYRYDKDFIGQVIDGDGKYYNTLLRYHVRPLQFPLEYDWIKLENELLTAGLIVKLQEGRTQIIVARIESIVNYWLEKLDMDPLYLLTQETKNWVEIIYSKTNKPFALEDFE